MPDKPERQPEDIFAAILGNLMVFDALAPFAYVTDTYLVLKDLRHDLDELVRKPLGFDTLEEMINTVLKSRKDLHYFDSGANRMAMEIAERFRLEIRRNIHRSVCEAAGVPPDPASGLLNLKNAKAVLVHASWRLSALDPKASANLAGLIARYDEAIKILLRKSTAATVIRKHPAAKKSVVS